MRSSQLARPLSLASVLSLAALALTASSPFAHAQTGVVDTWNGGASGSSSSWRTTANWSPSGIPGAYDEALFSSAGSSSAIGIAFSNSITVQQVGAISLDSADTHSRNINDSSGTYNGTLQLNGYNGTNLLLSNASTNNLTIANVYSGGKTMALSLPTATGTMDVTGTGNILITSQITGSTAVSVTNSTNTSGTGYVAFNNDSNNSTFTGTVTVGSGATFLASSVNALGSGGENAVTLNGGRFGLSANGSLSNNYSLTTAGSGFASASSVTTTITGVVSGSVGVTIGGSGNVQFNGANTYTGTTSVLSGAHLYAGSSNAFNGTALSTVSGAIVYLNGNNITTSKISGSAGSIDNGGATNATLTVNQSTNATFGGYIGDGSGGGTMSLVKTGSGTLTLSYSSSPFTGGVTVNGGTLSITNATAGASTSATGAGTVTVNSGGTLAGTGKAAGGIVLNSGGVLSPGTSGTSIATLSAASLVWNSGGIASFDLSNTDGTSDVLTVTGAFSGDAPGTGAYTFDLSGGQAGTTYTLVNFGSTNFTDANQFLAMGESGNFILNANSLQFLVGGASSSPEPGSLALLGIGALPVGFAGFRARRRRKA